MRQLLKGFKIFVTTIIVVFIVSYLASAAFVMFYGKDKIFSVISHEISQKMDASVQIKNISLGFFPFVYIQINDLSITKQGKYDAKIHKTKIYLNIVSILKNKSPLCIDLNKALFVLKNTSNKTNSKEKALVTTKSIKVKNNNKNFSNKKNNNEKSISETFAAIPFLSGLNLELSDLVFKMKDKKNIIKSLINGTGIVLLQSNTISLKLKIKNTIKTDSVKIEGISKFKVFLKFLQKDNLKYKIDLDLKEDAIDLGEVIKQKGANADLFLKGLYGIKTGYLKSDIIIEFGDNILNFNIVKRKNTTLEIRSDSLSTKGLETTNKILKKIEVKDLKSSILLSKNIHIKDFSCSLRDAKLAINGILKDKESKLNFSLKDADFTKLSGIVLEKEKSDIITGLFQTKGVVLLNNNKYIVNGDMLVKDFGYKAFSLNKFGNNLQKDSKIPIKIDLKNDGIWRTLKLNYVIKKDRYDFLNIYGTDNYITIRGSANLQREDLDSALQVLLPKNTIKNASFLEKDNKQLLPIRLHGKVRRPDIDMNYTLKYIADRFLGAKKQELQKKIDKKKKEIEQKLKSKLDAQKAKLEAEKAKRKKQLEAEKRKLKAKLEKEKNKAKNKAKNKLKGALGW